MYRNDLNTGDRAGTIALVALIHVGLAYAFLNISGTMRVIEREIIPQLIDVDVEPPPPPIVEVPLEKEKPKEKEGAASPKNIKSQATPVAAPKPRIELPVPPPMPVTETPRQGCDPTQGAAPVRGPGNRRGRHRHGDGQPAARAAARAAAAGGVAVSPSLVRGITNRDFPDADPAQLAAGRRDLPAAPGRGRRPAEPVRRHALLRRPQCRPMDLQPDHGARRLPPGTGRHGLPVAAWYGYIQRDTGRTHADRWISRVLLRHGRRREQGAARDDRSRMVGI